MKHLTHHVLEEWQVLLRFHAYETSLVGQWLRVHAPNTEGLGVIPGQGARSHMLQLRPRAVRLKKRKKFFLRNSCLKKISCLQWNDLLIGSLNQSQMCLEFSLGALVRPVTFPNMRLASLGARQSRTGDSRVDRSKEKQGAMENIRGQHLCYRR